MPRLGPGLALGGVGWLVALAQGLVAVGAQDRIGQPSMRNLDIGDTRNKLGVYSRAGLLGTGGNGLIPLLGRGKAGA